MNQHIINAKHVVVITTIITVILIPYVSFAEEYTVIISKGSSTQGCEVTDSCLNPSTITIHKGDSIRWIREDDVAHSIRGENYKGEMSFFTMNYENTFHKIGTISYHVTDMPWIRGTVIVDYAHQKLGNYVDFESAEKLDNQIFLTYKGHVDTNGAIFHVFDSTGRLVKKFGPSIVNDGFFSETFQFREFENYSNFKWVEGIYDVKMYIHDEEKNERILVQTTDFYLEINPHEKAKNSSHVLDAPTVSEEPETRQESKLGVASSIPDWVRNVFLWYGQEQIREDELLDAIKYLIKEKILVID